MLMDQRNSGNERILWEFWMDDEVLRARVGGRRQNVTVCGLIGGNKFNNVYAIRGYQLELTEKERRHVEARYLS